MKESYQGAIITALIAFLSACTMIILVAQVVIYTDCHSAYSESNINFKVVGMECLLQTKDGNWLPPTRYFTHLLK